MIVRPIGPTHEPLLALVGEAPGEEESRSGIPFVGKSGFLLKQMLASAGISFQECYVTNVVNERPLNNDFSVFYTGKGKNRLPTMELANHRARLWNELHTVKPKMIVALGNEALKALTNETSIDNSRGCMVHRRDLSVGYSIRVLPTYHPAYLLRVYGDRPIVESDLKKAYRQALRPHDPTPRFITDPSLDQVLGLLTQPPSTLSFDIETIGQHTRCLGFGWSDLDAMCIPLIRNGRSYWSESEESLIVKKLYSVLADPEIKKYIQNGPFDCTVIAKELGLHIDGIEIDTMFAHHLLFPELPKGLDFLSSIYTDFPMYWGPTRHSDDRENATYNCYDCCATFIAAKEIEKQLKDRGLWNFYQSTILPSVLALCRMQSRGIKVDTSMRETIRKEKVELLEKTQAELNLAVGFELNANSPKQVKELVYEKWKLPVQKKQKKVTVEDDALNALARKFPAYDTPLRQILTIRQTRKLVSTYVDMYLSSDGRMRTSFNPAGTVTGRISSSATFDGEGGNLQNIPRGNFRRLYTASEGKILIKADLKQAEFIAFCWFAKIERLIHEYTTNPKFDVHRWIASNIFQMAQELIAKKDRDDSKNCTYAGIYQVGPLKISKMYNIPFQRAKFILGEIARVIPELLEYWTDIQEALTTTRIIKNPLGRERVFFGRMDNDLFRRGYSHKCQSTVADIILKAIITLDAYEDGLPELLLQVHDELVCQCSNDPATIQIAVERIRSAMEQSIKVEGVEQPLLIPTEISIGLNWYDTQPYEEWKKTHGPVSVV